jgi:hypothetical protein
MNNRYTANLLAVLLISLLTSCATITRGKTDTLVINSNPSGALVEISNGLQAKTPASIKLPRSFEGLVTISREGYETVEVNVSSQVSGAGGAGMAGNVLLGGFIGAGVDASTGAMNDLVPNPIEVNLVPIGGTPASPAEAGQGSVEARLLELKKLLESGLINQDEYDSKRKVIVDSIQ